MADSENELIEGFINPLAWLEVDEPWKSATPTPLSAEGALRYLCPPGIQSDIESVASRYEEISIEAENRLFVVPNDARLLEKLIWPLRAAKGAYALGNFLSTIALCGMVMEMSAMLIFEISDAYMTRKGEKSALSEKDQRCLFGSRFERLGQDRRTDVLFALGLIDAELQAEFDRVRAIRRKYLHLFSQEHVDLAKDAVAAFRSSVVTVKATLGLSIGENGQVTFLPQLLRYIKSHDGQGEVGGDEHPA